MSSTRLLVTLVTLLVVSVAVVWARSAKTAGMESDSGRYKLCPVTGNGHAYMYKLDTVTGSVSMSEDGGQFVSR